MQRKIERFIKNKEWYHQRFDGSPLFISVIAEAEIKREKRKPAGTEANMRACFFKDRKCDWYLDMSDVRRGSEVMIGLAKKYPSISKKLIHAWKEDERSFEKFFNLTERIDFKRLRDSELIDLFKRYHKLIVDRFTSSAIIDHFALGTDEHIAKMLRQEVGEIKKESEFTEIFSIATAPVHQSFINQAEMELLKIAIETPHDEQKIAAYQKKYFWTRNNYIDIYILTATHFRKEINFWRKSRVDLKEKYRQLLNTSKINQKRKATLFRKYKFSRLLRVLLKISEDFTWWQDERKKATYLNIHIGMRIVGEMARRKHLATELAKYLTLEEIEPWFESGFFTANELKKRQRDCVIIWWRGGYYVVTGREVRRIHDTMFSAKKNDNVNDIRGLAASVGRVMGPVKIVGSVQEISKVQRGDVMVAVMTRPDYIAGIKKAAAIVTNEGGITCHAAIVSRELGIPCIIGTKIATEVLKDNDIVEVNANHGVVTMIKRN